MSETFASSNGADNCVKMAILALKVFLLQKQTTKTNKISSSVSCKLRGTALKRDEDVHLDLLLFCVLVRQSFSFVCLLLELPSLNLLFTTLITAKEKDKGEQDRIGARTERDREREIKGLKSYMPVFQKVSKHAKELLWGNSLRVFRENDHQILEVLFHFLKS